MTLFHGRGQNSLPLNPEATRCQTCMVKEHSVHMLSAASGAPRQSWRMGLCRQNNALPLVHPPWESAYWTPTSTKSCILALPGMGGASWRPYWAPAQSSQSSIIFLPGYIAQDYCLALFLLQFSGLPNSPCLFPSNPHGLALTFFLPVVQTRKISWYIKDSTKLQSYCRLW